MLTGEGEQMDTGRADDWGSWAEPQGWAGEEEWEWNEPPVGQIGADTVAICGVIATIGSGGTLAPLVVPATAAMYGAGAVVDAGHRQMADGKQQEVETGKPSRKVKVGLVVSLLGCGLGGLVALAVAAFGLAAGIVHNNEQ